MKEESSMKNKACCVFKMAMKKAKDLIEISQIKVKMSDIKGKIEKKYVIIGSSLYSKHKDGEKVRSDDEFFVKIYDDISMLFEELKKLREELDFVKCDNAGSCRNRNERCGKGKWECEAGRCENECGFENTSER